MYKEFENKNHECEKVVGRKNYMRKWWEKEEKHVWNRYVNEDERPFELKEKMKKTTLQKNEAKVVGALRNCDDEER